MLYFYQSDTPTFYFVIFTSSFFSISRKTQKPYALKVINKAKVKGKVCIHKFLCLKFL